MKKRIEYIDMAKGISMLVIIMFHLRLDIMEQNASNDWFLLVFGPFAVTVFFILSGMTYKFDPNFKNYFLKKTKGYLIPYAGFGIILVLTFWVGGAFKLSALWDAFKNMVLQQRFTTLWFLAALYVGIMIFWLICFLCRDNIKAILAVSLVISALSMYFSDKYKTQWIWNADTAGCVQIYLALGYLCKKINLPEKLDKLNLPKKLVGAFVLFAIEIGIGLLNRHLGFKDLQMYYSDYGCVPLTLLASIAGGAAIILIASSFTLKPISYVGRNSLSFFALHQTVFMEIMYIIYGLLKVPYNSPDSHAYLICRPITFIFVIAGCTAFDLLVSKTKARIILGK